MTTTNSGANIYSWSRSAQLAASVEATWEQRPEAAKCMPEGKELRAPLSHPVFEADLEMFIHRIGFVPPDHVYRDRLLPWAVEMVAGAAQAEIRQDLQQGIIPPHITSFSELHDYLDANGYGRAFEWSGPDRDVEDAEYVEAFCQFWNEVQSKIHIWIQAGGLRATAEEDSVLDRAFKGSL